MRIGRRRFITGSAAAAAGAAVPLSYLFSARAPAPSSLVTDEGGVLDLPEGFTYRVVERSGQRMDDGYRVPALPDGMACFDGGDGTLVLMRNHEVSAGDVARGPYTGRQRPPPEAYSRRGMGGVTRVVMDASSLERISSNLVLVGTVRNCAGGPSPWGWLSCEETVIRGHGYVFLCPTDAATVAPARRIVGYGRCNHEAAAIDPVTHAAYLTEDRGNGALYRFVPDDREQPFDGRLQALRVVGRPGLDTGNGLRVGDRFEVDWVDIEEPDPADDTLRIEARSKGAAAVRRGEGMWWAQDALYVCATAGGPVASGQLFRYVPMRSGTATDGGTLELVAQSEDPARLHMPDNITVAPSGEVYMAEDGTLGRNHVRVLRRDGTIADFARNARSSGEVAGVCFAPDGRTLFLNLQHEGLTLAVTGPFAAPGVAQAG